MSKWFTILLVLALLMVLGSVAFALDHARVKAIPQNQAILTGEEPAPPNAIYVPSLPGAIAQSPGDTIGDTQYDYQTNGSTGTRVVVDHQSNIHFSWMKGMPYPSTRHIYYNCVTPAGQIYPAVGNQADHSQASGAGYTTCDVTLDDRATVFYHRAPTGAESTFVGLDIANCLSTFYYRRPPSRQGSLGFIWPYGAVDRNDRIHMVMTNNAASGGQAFMYTRSNNGGTTWTSIQRVDTLMDISAMVTASRVSDKVAIVYTAPKDLVSQWHNDIVYVLSNDGITWDFRDGRVNVTNYDNDFSYFAYTDCDAVFDYNDNLHIIWNANYLFADTIEYESHLMHYDLASQEFSLVAVSDSLWPDAGCDFGVWQWGMAKMSIAPSISNDLFVTYTAWDTSDCAANGYANGDIYLNWSTDGGATWSPRYNMTDSHTPGCEAGDCDSDHWSSLAEVVDTSLHLFYVNDKDAGGIPQTEGQVTDNPMLYYTYVAPPLVGVNDDIKTPKSFTLSQNYPNPFNARTNIEFELEKDSDVELAVYDITGAKTATLVNRRLDAGAHQVNWDASRISSGVYYYTLKANGSEATKKMTLIK
jgi:hypothetical protein